MAPLCLNLNCTLKKWVSVQHDQWGNSTDTSTLPTNFELLGGDIPSNSTSQSFQFLKNFFFSKN